MKEKLLVLAKACPESSAKYEHLVCVAGITDKGEWRRIYPIPWKNFWSISITNFKKKSWIEYELVNETPSDHRPESRKIHFDTIKPLGEENYPKIKKILDEKLLTIEEIQQKGPKTMSLGVIKPREIIDFIPIDNKQYDKLVTRGEQTDLFGKPALKLDIPKHKYQYEFRDTKVHQMLCEDWEVAELYRNCENYRRQGIYKDENEVHEKVKNKMLNEIGKKDPYFIVGSHYRFSTYMIVGVVYPRKSDIK